MFSAFAAMPPMTMAISVRSPSQVGKMPVQPAVGFAADATLGRVPAAAPTVSSSTQDRNRPSPAHSAIARLLVSGLK